MKALKLRFGKGNYPANVEIYESSMEVVSLLQKREITDSEFMNMKEEVDDKDWYGVSRYSEALSLLNNGWDGPVKQINDMIKKLSMNTDMKRYQYRNNVEGFAPIVPLALMGIPNAMRDMYRRPIKNKVIDVMYNNELLCFNTAEDYMEASLELLRTIIQLEQSGYRINLWIIQSYFDEDTGSDVMVCKIKEASQLLDSKRIAFPVAHPAMFRVIGFDWYSRVPNGTPRPGYGGLTELEDLEDLVQKITRNKTTYVVRADDILTSLNEGKVGYTKELLLRSENNKKVHN